MEVDNILKWINDTEMNYDHTFQGKIFILFYLSKHEAVTPNALADSLKVSRSRITVILKDLEEENMIIRTKDISDKRKVSISLASKGKEFTENKLKELRQDITEVLQIVGIDKFNTYMEVMNAICKIMQKRRKINETNN